MDGQPKPVISPIAALLKSRKTMVALITAILNILIAFVPGLEAHRADLLTISLILTTLLGSVLIGSIAHEDAARNTPPTSSASPKLSLGVTTTGGATASATVSSPEMQPPTIITP